MCHSVMTLWWQPGKAMYQHAGLTQWATLGSLLLEYMEVINRLLSEDKFGPCGYQSITQLEKTLNVILWVYIIQKRLCFQSENLEDVFTSTWHIDSTFKMGVWCTPYTHYVLYLIVMSLCSRALISFSLSGGTDLHRREDIDSVSSFILNSTASYWQYINSSTLQANCRRY